jgi:hypothetical protein
MGPIAAPGSPVAEPATRLQTKSKTVSLVSHEPTVQLQPHPIAPPGTRVLVHEKPADQETWSPHGTHGWYVGPALDLYRCYRTWVLYTRCERICNTQCTSQCPLPIQSISLSRRRAQHCPSPQQPICKLPTSATNRQRNRNPSNLDRSPPQSKLSDTSTSTPSSNTPSTGGASSEGA